MFVCLRLLTCICFCGCDVWVAAGSAFSRGPRALSLPSELIIYSIYKTLYVQNRKICKGNKTHTGEKNECSCTHRLRRCYIVVTAEPQHFPSCDRIGEMCVVWIAKPHCAIVNTALMEAVRHTVGLVTEQLYWKSRSRRESDPVSAYKRHRPQCVCEAEQTLHTLTSHPLQVQDSLQQPRL